MKFSILLSTILFIVSSQSIASDTLYFNNQNSQVLIRDSADYYRVLTRYDEAEEKYYYSEFYITGEKKLNGVTNDFNSPTKSGSYTSYYKNGLKKSEGKNNDFINSGLWSYWYANGQLKEILEFTSTEMDYNYSFNIIEAYDSLGEHQVSKGNGTYKIYNEDLSMDSGMVSNTKKVGEWIGARQHSATYRESYNQGKLIEGVSYDSSGKAYHYNELVIQPEFQGGLQKFYILLSKEIRYPEKARRRDIQGMVYVDFIVEKNGSLSEVNCTRGISPECDAEAVRVVKLLDKWNPGKVRGRPVSVKMSVPIVYKLR